MLTLKVWTVTYEACWRDYPNDTVKRQVSVLAESIEEAKEAAHQALLAKKFNRLDSCGNCRYVGKHSISSVLEDSPLVIGDTQLKALKHALDSLEIPMYVDNDFFDTNRTE